MFMTILPALMAALVVGGYSLVSRLVDVRDTNAQRQQLVTDSFAARLRAPPPPIPPASNSCFASYWKPGTCAPPRWNSRMIALPCMPGQDCGQ